MAFAPAVFAGSDVQLLAFVQLPPDAAVQVGVPDHRRRLQHQRARTDLQHVARRMLKLLRLKGLEGRKVARV